MKKQWIRFFSMIFIVTLIFPTLTAAASGQSDYFSPTGVQQLIYNNAERAVILEDKETIKQTVDFLKKCGAKREELTSESDNGITVTLRGQGKEYSYWIGALPGQKEKELAVFTDRGSYRTSSDLVPLVDFLENCLEQTDPYTYFTKLTEETQVKLLNNEEHRAVIPTEQMKIAQLMNRLNAKKVSQPTSLGKKLDRAAEIRLFPNPSLDNRTYAYQLYEKGAAVTPSDTAGAEKTEYFLCNAKTVQQLYALMQLDYQNNPKYSAWLAAANENRINRASVSLRSENISDYPLPNSYLGGFLSELKGAQVGKVKEATSLWSKPDAEYRFHFLSGVEYRVQIMGNRLKIASSDMKQILEYPLKAGDAAIILDFTSQQLKLIEKGESKPNPETAKPVIYLYPEKETKVNVKLDFNGKLDSTYPLYPKEGWTVTAKPDGTLIDADGRSYRYLFWEGTANVDWKQDSGFLVKAEDAQAFLEKSLTALGLNQLEQNDFITYWLPKLQENEQSFVTFAAEQYTDAAKLTVTPKPDSVLRVQMLMCKADRNNISYFEKLPQQKLPSFERKGFTLVEWGGTDLSER